MASTRRWFDRALPERCRRTPRLPNNRTDLSRFGAMQGGFFNCVNQPSARAVFSCPNAAIAPTHRRIHAKTRPKSARQLRRNLLQRNTGICTTDAQQRNRRLPHHLWAFRVYAYFVCTTDAQQIHSRCTTNAQQVNTYKRM